MLIDLRDFWIWVGEKNCSLPSKATVLEMFIHSLDI